MFFYAGCYLRSLSSHLQMKYETTPAATEIKNEANNRITITSFPLPD